MKKKLLIICSSFICLIILDGLVWLNEVQGRPLAMMFHMPAESMRVVDYNTENYLSEITTRVATMRKTGASYQINFGTSAPIMMSEVDQLLSDRHIHPTVALGLYSMHYMHDALDQYDKNPDPDLYKQIIILTNSILEKIEKFDISPNLMKYNDHVVSDRVEVLLRLSSKLQQLGTDSSLRSRINKHIMHHIDLLLDNKHFTWSTNHGLMQIRALFRSASLLPVDSHYRSDCLVMGLERLTKVLPYFIADDGAVLESSSAYWVFIYKTLFDIYTNDVLSKDIKNNLDSIMYKIRAFIQTAGAGNGYLQGMGDGYSQKLSELYFKWDNTAKVYQFENGLFGIKYPSKSSYVSIQLISLDTPPNIHKLPEDLAVYVYVGEPLFLNAGTYAYDKSVDRLHVLSENTQSTVSFNESGTVHSSSINNFEWMPDSTVIHIQGIKRYDKDLIKRSLTFNSQDGLLTIIDQSSKTVISRFNINPNYEIKNLTSKTFELASGEDIIQVAFTGKLEVRDTWVSQQPFQKSNIKQVEISGNPVIVKIILPKPVETINRYEKFPALRATDRFKKSLELSRQYWRANIFRLHSKSNFKMIRAMLIGSFTIFLILFIMFSGSIIFHIILYSHVGLLLIDILCQGDLFMAGLLLYKSILS